MDNNKKPRRNPRLHRILLAVSGLLLVGVLITLAFALPKTEPIQPEAISLNRAAADIAAGRVVRIEDDTTLGQYRVFYEGDVVKEGFRDTQTSLIEQLSILGLTGKQLSALEIEVVKNSASANANSRFWVLGGMIGLPFLVAFVISQRERSGTGKKNFKEALVPSITFKDVAGLEENSQELQDIVSFLKDGDRYADMGAKMPRGILMVGDPGTGKTLVARALAGEAGVPFFATSGSEFVEVFVGVGASRVRSLFQKARKKAPCIIFIDEIDAVGRARHRSESGSDMEQDQTLNQLLVEMDGFAAASGVIVLAATNRLDILDPALTRPGRFDRRIHMQRPDLKGREAILKVHVKGKRLDPAVNLQTVARSTPGLVGADLANVVNEAAIGAARSGRKDIQQGDFEEAIEKVLGGGVQRKSSVMSGEERRIVAYHEAGHAVVMHVTPHADPVYKITIIPRGQMGGYTMSLPEEEAQLVSRRKLLARITGLLGGRAAEELFFQDVTSGASNDLQVATQLAEEMVMRLGMERSAGLRVHSQGRYPFMGSSSSQKTIEALDEAVNNILESCYNEAKQILLDRQAALDAVAGDLLDVETIGRERFTELMENN